jgi:hypothetical protein
VKAATQARQAEVKRTLGEDSAAGKTAGDAYQPFVSDMKDIFGAGRQVRNRISVTCQCQTPPNSTARGRTSTRLPRRGFVVLALLSAWEFRSAITS